MKSILYFLLVFLTAPVFLTSQMSITTTFTDGNGSAGNMFDLVLKQDHFITIDSLAVNLETSGPQFKEVSVYYKTGTFAGFENDCNAWTLVGTDNVESAGQNMPSIVDVGPIQLIGPATYSLFVVDNSSNIDYTNGSQVGAVFVEDAYLQILEGIGRGVNVGDPCAGSIFDPRIWNGTIYYTVGGIVPTLTQWGIILLSLLMIIIGITAVKYKRKSLISN